LGRAAAQAEQRMEGQGDGRPPVPYALLALGRIGRNECLLAPESEHALVFESGDTDGFADRWFASFAGHLGDVLRGATLPAAAGEATDPRWRASLDGWRTSVNGWIAQPHPPLADIARFVDSTFVFGDDELAGDVLGMARDLLAGAPALLSAMVPAPARAPSLTADRRIDLASAGLEPIEGAARVLALAGRVAARATGERLGEAALHTGLSQATADDLVERHELLLRCVLDQQLADGAAGVELSYAIDPGRLDEAARTALTATLSHVAGIRPVVRMALASI
ncbi:MAG: putative nucleotidyltransferase substrate binding domain-containing protein, partial [Candidatus Binatia bacterium]